MIDNEKEFYDYAAYYGISDFADLSIAEVIILEFLARYTNSVIRHELFTQVRQFIEYQEDFTPLRRLNKESEEKRKFYNYVQKSKTYGTSSFYNSLKNLEKRGLLKFNHEENKKRPQIEPTLFTNYIPKLLMKFLINNLVLNEKSNKMKPQAGLFLDVMHEFKKSGKLSPSKRVLSIWFSEFIVFSIIEQIAEHVDMLYILPKNESKVDISLLSKEKIKLSKLDNRKIYAPENEFDAVIVPVYKKNPKFFGMDRIELLEEIKRVTKPKGLICLISMADLPLTENQYANELIKLYKVLINNRLFTHEEMESDLVNGGLMEVKISEKDGLLIGTALNKK
ncbi:MAG: hypothetical protein JW891_05860 [Candidatus Lokiarchaeota archaeon]|nr:hypothetical protein [Candidatus Lokiarchaeota archaeon]